MTYHRKSSYNAWDVRFSW